MNTFYLNFNKSIKEIDSLYPVPKLKSDENIHIKKIAQIRDTIDEKMNFLKEILIKLFKRSDLFKESFLLFYEKVVDKNN